MIKVYFLITLLGAGVVAGAILARLGIEEQTARKFILNNIAGDFSDGFQEVEEDTGGTDSGGGEKKSFGIPRASLLPAIIKGDKAAAALELCEYVKSYVNSADFAADYAAKRAKAKPTSEPWRPDDKMIKDQEAQIIKAEKDLAAASKYFTEEVNKKNKAAIALQKKQIEQWKDPHPNKTRWEKMYPEDPAILVRRRLEEYLQLAATVDFDAAVATGNKKKFVDPKYEGKSLKWKAIYRAGKEVNTVVTAFAKKWL